MLEVERLRPEEVGKGPGWPKFCDVLRLSPGPEMLGMLLKDDGKDDWKLW
jgi:hypothetical protein